MTSLKLSVAEATDTSVGVTDPNRKNRHRTLPLRTWSSVVVRRGFFIVLALGIFLRYWRLNALGFNSDEAVYAGQAASIAGQSAP